MYMVCEQRVVLYHNMTNTNGASIHEKIKNDIKDAMRAKDVVKLNVLRGLASTFTNELIAKGPSKGAPEGMLSDEDATALIRRSVKQHKDSIDQFEKGGRQDLVADEKAELVVLEAFLPQLMNRDEIKKIVAAKIASQGALDKTKIGQFTGLIMKELKCKADGADVKAVIEELAK